MAITLRCTFFMSTLHTPISELGGLVKRFARPLKRLGITTIADVLWYFPTGYEDRRKLAAIAHISGNEGSAMTIKCRIQLLHAKRSAFKRVFITEGLVSDSTGTLRIVWFGNQFIHKALHVGDEVYFCGRVYTDRYGSQMRQPEYEKVTHDETIHAAAIVPRYGLTRGLTSRQMRFVVSKAMPLRLEIEDWVPELIRKKNGLCELSHAIKSMHFPSDWKEYHIARRRLAFDELFRVQLRALATRHELETMRASPIHFQEEMMKEWVLHLPFTLTNDQKKAGWQIVKDMMQTFPMNRLLQGDVGSGKTVVAALAMVHACAGGHTAVLMAPTDILARQHFGTLQALFGSTSYTLGLYTRTQHMLSCGGKKDEFSKKECIQRIAQHKVDVVVGTHALLYEPLQLPDLGVVIVDEQHRFGVRQRRQLKERSTAAYAPHFLSMTATPIPRSVLLTLYGELKVSVITEKPAGRKPIVTKLVSEHAREETFLFVRNQIDRGYQVFVVCPIIDSSDVLEVISVEEKLQEFKEGPFKKYRVEMLHGKMKAKDKEAIMDRMLRREIDVLISTSVIEVGVDVPNATVMIIEGAERFGLAQLHQFRGRIGRSNYQSYCFVFASAHSNPHNQRLRLFEKVSDGFALAQADFEQRGGGDMYGTMQSGFPDLRVASLHDTDLIECAHKEAALVWHDDKEKKLYPSLWEYMTAWEEGKVHLE